jgi:hypothetical protein
LIDKSVAAPVWAEMTAAGDGDITAPTALESATFVAVGLIAGAGKQWSGKMDVCPRVWFEATTPSIFAPANTF